MTGKTSLKSLRTMLDKKEISAAELTKEYIDTAKRKNPELQALISITEDEALSGAEKAQKIIDSGKAKALTGIPAVLKDNICTDGVKTTCASKMLENFIPPYNATVVEKLLADDYILSESEYGRIAMAVRRRLPLLRKQRTPATRAVFRAAHRAEARRRLPRVCAPMP